MRKTTIATAVLAGATQFLSAANAGTLIPVVPFTNSTSTYANGINDSNTIAGIYTRADGTQHGFVGPISGEGYSTFDFGGGGHTYAYAISNEGWIVGLDNTLSDDCPVFGCQYVRQPSGEPDQILRDGVGVDGVPGQIVANQKFAAEYWTLDQNENATASGYFGKGSSFVKKLKFPIDSTRVRPRGYGKNGDVLGFYHDSVNRNYPGFILHKKILTTVNYPDAYYTEFEGINDKGVIVGGWFNQDQSAGQPFMYDAKKGTFKIIKIPGSVTGLARQINKDGLITIYSDQGSFIYCSKKKTCPSAEGAIEVEEKSVPAERVRWLPCKNGCVALFPRNAERVDPARLRAAMERDEDLRIQLTSPYLR